MLIERVNSAVGNQAIEVNAYIIAFGVAKGLKQQGHFAS